MEINSVAGIFFEITDLFFVRRLARSVVPFAQICAFVLLVSTMLHGDAHFKEAVAEAAALHAHDELFSRHIELEPAPEDPVDWAMAEASDDEDDAPMPDAPPEPEIVDMPPAPASAPPMSNLERCVALRLVYGAGPR